MLTGFVTVLLLLLFYPAILTTSAEHDEEHDEKDEFIGISRVGITKPFPAASDRTQTSIRVRNFLIDFDIPNTTHHVRCELVENLHLFNLNNDDNNGSTTNNPVDDDDNWCHYAGLAQFDEFPYRTKCVFSLCPGIKTGFVWLPGERAFLQLSIMEDDIHANLTKRGKLDHYSVLDPDPDGTKGRAFAPKTTENVHWAHQLLLDTIPPNWYHFRVMALLTPETFHSPILGSKRRRTIEVVSSIFNLVNVIWSQMNMTVYLKRIVIWTGNTTVDGLELPAFPDTDWHYEPRPEIFVLKPAIRIANDEIWPKMTEQDAVDYIVFIRNLNGQRAPSGSNIIGLAYPESVCQKRMQFASLLGVRTANVHSAPETVLALATVISHELGHAFGVYNHDEPHCICPSRDRRCIMHPSVDGEFRKLVQWAWSDCSVNLITNYLRRLETISPLCLHNVPDIPAAFSNKTDPVCGNGIIETGEECDCGPGSAIGGPPRHYFSTIFCENPRCCDYRTCKLRSNAQCAAGPCCNSSTCSFYDNRTICRQSFTECDIAETCTGASPFCPRERFYMTGTPCQDNGEGTCHLGQCISRFERCSTLMGGSYEDKTTEQCFRLNERGMFAANCGHLHYRPGYIYGENIHYREMTPCSPADCECGSLMCTHANNEMLSEKAVTARRQYLPGSNVTCHSVAGQVLPDVGLAPDGMLCDQGRKYCRRQRCQMEIPTCNEEPPCDHLGQHVDNETQQQLKTPCPPTKPPLPATTAPQCHRQTDLITIIVQTFCLVFAANFEM